MIAKDAQKTATSPLFCIFMEHNWEKALKFLYKEGTQSAFIYSKNPEVIFEKIKKKFKFVPAAGGIVYNPKGDILTMKRLGKWDFPKGKKEDKETWKECAVREVEEECGVENIEIGELLAVTYHCFKRNGKRCLKKTKWYKMYVENYHKTAPQLEEDITEIAWIHPKLCTLDDFDTYTSIRELLFDAKIGN